MNFAAFTHLPLVWLAIVNVALAEASLSIEIAAASRAQVTAPQTWLQLFAELGYTDVRLRQSTPGERPSVESTGNEARPHYHVLAVVEANGTLRLPGGSFTARDRARLGGHLQLLADQGPEALTAERGKFGLTEKQFKATFAQLTPSLGTTTAGKSLSELLQHATGKLQLPIDIDPAARPLITRAAAVRDEVGELSGGTALAWLLAGENLGLVPTVVSGGEVRLVVQPRDLEQDLKCENYWPLGWPVDAPPSQVAPRMMEFLNVEIDGYTLERAVAAVEPRIGVPVAWDRGLLAEAKIDPAQIMVKIPRTRTYVMRVLDRALFQARLRGTLRTDEAGHALYVIAR